MFLTNENKILISKHVLLVLEPVLTPKKLCKFIYRHLELCNIAYITGSVEFAL